MEAPAERRGGLETNRWRGHDGRGNPDGGRAGAMESAERSTAQDHAAHGAPRSGQDAPARVWRGGRQVVCRGKRAEGRASTGPAETGHRAEGATARCGGAPGTGKPMSASGAPSRQRGDAATDACVEQGLEAGPAGMSANGEGARSGGDVASAAHAGEALEGMHRRGGTRPGEAGGHPPAQPRRGPKPGEPQGREQDATRLHRPRRRKPSRWWKTTRTEHARCVAAPGRSQRRRWRETPSGNLNDGGAVIENPRAGVRSRTG
jgi:hypothetical protein